MKKIIYVLIAFLVGIGITFLYHKGMLHEVSPLWLVVPFVLVPFLRKYLWKRQ
ncbi:hypothetical protein [Ornithobacterium rhinotracheale]|uniref:hypothetical protein n=1 Tax=Ornithobacterium rhinotracheale TaxID=28251 RepID=UPI00403619A2